MAIDNPQAVRFCNEQIRILADTLLTALRTAEAVREFYHAHPELGDLFYSNSSELVEDGSATDGRPRLTGNDVLALVARADELSADYRANSNAKLNTVLKAAVNGQSRV